MERNKSGENGIELQKIRIRRAEINDIPRILGFVDIYLRRDWLLRRPYLVEKIKHKVSYIAEENEKIVAWATCDKGRLYNLLIHPAYRGFGIGAHFIKFLNPSIIRSKSDQSTGDPTKFYEKLGYKIISQKEGRKRNINIMIKDENFIKGE